jgi:hypothetical protein
MTNNSEGTELVMRRVAAGELAGVPDRATRVVSWIGWHLFEIGGVTVPAVAAVVVSPWVWLVSGAVGAGWTVHAVRTGRAQAAIKAGRDLPAVATSPVETATTTDVNDQDGGADDVRDSIEVNG